MSQALEVVKRVSEAWEKKDTKTYRSLLHNDYKFQGPMMEMCSADEAEAFAQNCPFSCSSENATYVAEGNKVVKIFDWIVTSPVKFQLRMVEFSVVEDGKIRSVELFYDTAKFPKEAMEVLGPKMAANAV